jgi:GntR family transcriptional regulator/MocR family aminotransferase
VPVDGEGLVVERLPTDANVICVAPSHQFPLGVAMSMRRRAALIDFARTHKAVIVEDDYDGEYRFGERPLDALQTLDRNGELVFYVGTFSKSLFAGTRLGFVVAPAWAHRALAAAKQLADQSSSVLDQDTLAAFIADGHLARHVRKMRRVYAARRERLVTRLQKDFRRWLEPIPSCAGMHVAAFATPSLDVPNLVKRALERDVAVYPLRMYYIAEPARDGLVFGYGTLDERGIDEGLTRLRRLLA